MEPLLLTKDEGVPNDGRIAGPPAKQDREVLQGFPLHDSSRERQVRSRGAQFGWRQPKPRPTQCS